MLPVSSVQGVVIVNAVRPLIILRSDSDIAKLNTAARAAVACRSADGLIVIDIPSKRSTRLNRILDFRSCPDADAAVLGRRGRDFADDLEQLGMRFRIEVSRDLKQSKILRIARQFHSDLVIVERRPNLSGRFLSFLNENIRMLTDSRIPVWLCGRHVEPDAPIVAAVDPVPETQAGIENNSRVIRTAFALASRYAPKKKIHFMALCDDESGLPTDSSKSRHMRVMNDLRIEIFRTWANYSQRAATNASGESRLSGISPCVPVHISMHRGSPELAAMTLDEIQPKVIVTGEPLRSAVRRFFQPGMLSIFATGEFSVLSVTEQRLISDESGATALGRRDSLSANIRRDKICRREIVC